MTKPTVSFSRIIFLIAWTSLLVASIIAK